MFTLPKGAPVVTSLPTMRESVPAFLSRLAQSRFTGYARYNFAASMAVLLFSDGKLLSAMVSRGGVRLANLDALTELCQRVATEDGSIDVFRLDADLTMALHGLLHGDALLRDQEIKLMDVKALTAQLKAQRFNGCIRVHTTSRTSLVFYKDGAGFGFFHDGSEHLETTATESQKIANLPGARMDVLATRPMAQLQAYDMLEVVNLQKLWDSIVRSRQAEFEKLRAQAEEAERARLEGKLTALEESLKQLAGEVLGALGKNLLAKELAAQGGRGALLEVEKVAAVLAGVEKGAKLVAGASKVKELVERLKAEVLRQLGGQGI
jgi:hypothetical protein